jgi:hypothetical protein
MDALRKVVLLPCPFCGGDAEVWARNNSMVHCPKCLVNFVTCYHTSDKSAAELSAEKWNTRAVRSLEPGTGWVSVADRLPECNRSRDSLGIEVYVYPRISGRATAFYGKRIKGNVACWYFAGGELHGITHWRELPSPPATDNQENGNG